MIAEMILPQTGWGTLAIGGWGLSCTVALLSNRWRPVALVANITCAWLLGWTPGVVMSALLCAGLLYEANSLAEERAEGLRG